MNTGLRTALSALVGGGYGGTVGYFSSKDKPTRIARGLIGATIGGTASGLWTHMRYKDREKLDRLARAGIKVETPATARYRRVGGLIGAGIGALDVLALHAAKKKFKAIDIPIDAGIIGVNSLLGYIAGGAIGRHKDLKKYK